MNRVQRGPFADPAKQAHEPGAAQGGSRNPAEHPHEPGAAHVDVANPAKRAHARQRSVVFQGVVSRLEA